MDKKIVDAIKSTKSVSELKDLAAKNGYNLTDDQAKKYFDLFHGDKAVSENELDNVAGGQGDFCEFFGRATDSKYSSDAPHYLITTWTNYCHLFVLDKARGLGSDEYCCNCAYHVESTGPTIYCKKRTKDNDPCVGTAGVGIIHD